MNHRRVLLGCDTGEAPAGEERDRERALLPYIDAVSIACGGHAGDEASIQYAIEGAIEHGCVIGAHPSYPDREGFGRKRIEIARADLKASLQSQLHAIAQAAHTLGTSIEFVKPHGALYHDIATDADLAVVLAGVFQQVLPEAQIVLPLGSCMIEPLTSAGHRVLPEGFCDRAYECDGSLRSRDRAGALITDPNRAADQCEELVRGGRCNLLCVHSDTPDAIAIAKAVRTRLRSLENG